MYGNQLRQRRPVSRIKQAMREGTKRPEEDEVSEYVFARALYPTIHVYSSVLHAFAGVLRQGRV